MITLPNRTILVTSMADLPERFEKPDMVFMDFETNNVSGMEFPSSFKGDRICGVTICDSICPPMYIPIRHTEQVWDVGNLPVAPVMAWIQARLNEAKSWVNHNIKFDTHFAKAEGLEFDHLQLICTMQGMKLVDSDRMSYSLDDIGRDIFGFEYPEYSRVKAYLAGIKSKNYADCPPDVLGAYANRDAADTRILHLYIQKNMPDDSRPVWHTEVKLTSVLYDIEQVGLHVNERELKTEKLRVLRRMMEIIQRIQDLTGFEINPKSPDDIYDLLIVQYGLPVLAYTKDDEGNDTENASFAKDVYKQYTIHPKVLSNPKLKEIVDLIQEYRQLAQYHSLFIESFLEHAVDGVLHSDYRQMVRTGRMACSRPNAQQMNTLAKYLIHPEPGHAFLSFDYSQIEFRLIIIYTNTLEAIEAYQRDPKTDFHQYVADLCGINRKQAKNINFAIGFGAGKRKILRMLASDPLVIKRVGQELADEVSSGMSFDSRVYQGRAMKWSLNEEFTERCEQLALKTYNDWHARFPNLKLKQRQASDLVRLRGYIKTAYGRRRNIAPERSHIAFNSAVQGSAGDIFKESVVKLAPRFNEKMREWKITIRALVHDQVVFQGPIEIMRREEVREYIAREMATLSKSFAVPIFVEGGYSEKSWGEADGDDNVEYPDHVAGPFELKRELLST